MGRLRNRGLYQCKGCRYQASLTAGTVFHKTRTAMRHRDSRYKLSGLIELDDASFGHKGQRTTRAGGTEKAVRVLVSTTDEGKPKFAKMAVADYAGVLQAQKRVPDQVEPNYLFVHPLAFRLGVAYERLVNRCPQLSRLRANILGRLEK